MYDFFIGIWYTILKAVTKISVLVNVSTQSIVLLNIYPNPEEILEAGKCEGSLDLNISWDIKKGGHLNL